MKYTDLGMQSEQDQINNDLLGDQEEEFDERKDSQPIWMNADQNQSYQHRFSANTRICDEFKRTGACLLSGCNDIMHQCFRKKKIQKDKKLFDRETRELVKERKYVKTKLSCKQLSPQCHGNLNCKTGKLDKKSDAKVAEFHINMVK